LNYYIQYLLVCFRCCMDWRRTQAVLNRSPEAGQRRLAWDST